MEVCAEPISQATLSYNNYSQLLIPKYQPTQFHICIYTELSVGTYTKSHGAISVLSQH